MPFLGTLWLNRELIADPGDGVWVLRKAVELEDKSCIPCVAWSEQAEVYMGLVPGAYWTQRF